MTVNRVGILNAEDTSGPTEELSSWSKKSPQDALYDYVVEFGWPVEMDPHNRPCLRLGRGRGYAAVRGPRAAIEGIGDVRDCYRIVTGPDAFALMTHDGPQLRRTTIDLPGMWLAGSENAGEAKRRVDVTLTVCGDGELVPLPCLGSDASWDTVSEPWFARMPLWLVNPEQAVTLSPTSLDESQAATETGLVRPGRVTSLYGSDADTITTLALGLVDRQVSEGRRCGYLDYRGRDRAWMAQMLSRIGTDLSRIDYVERPPAWDSRLDLSKVVSAETGLLVVDDLAGLFRASGRTARSGEHVLPVFADLERIATGHGIAVVVTDRSTGKTPAGAREKLDCVDAAWLVSLDRGLVHLVGTKDAADRWVRIETGDDRLIVEFDVDEPPGEEALRREVGEAMIEHVRRCPGVVTRTQLADEFNHAVPRRIRREAVAELLALGLLVEASEPRSERGASRTRAVLYVPTSER